MNDKEKEAILPYAAVIIKLLQGEVYIDEPVWKTMIAYQREIYEHFSKIGLRFILDEKEGFAYLTQDDNSEEYNLPRLIRRMPIRYEASLLCVLLREELEEFDVRNTDSSLLQITDKQIKEKIEMYFKEKSDQTKLLRNFDNYINQIVSFGFLKEIKSESAVDNEKTYEVKRILKAKITNEKLEEIREKMRNNGNTL